MYDRDKDRRVFHHPRHTVAIRRRASLSHRVITIHRVMRALDPDEDCGPHVNHHWICIRNAARRGYDRSLGSKLTSGGLGFFLELEGKNKEVGEWITVILLGVSSSFPSWNPGHRQAIPLDSFFSENSFNLIIFLFLFFLRENFFF